VACFSSAESAGGSSSTPNCSSVSSSRNWPCAAATQTSALAKLFRTEWRLVLLDMSPHSATMSPSWMTRPDVDPDFFAKAIARARPLVEKPCVAGAACSQEAPGTRCIASAAHDTEGIPEMISAMTLVAMVLEWDIDEMNANELSPDSRTELLLVCLPPWPRSCDHAQGILGWTDQCSQPTRYRTLTTDS
jgi:hypothetical protein